MEFKLFAKLADLEGVELWMLLAAAAAFAALAAVALVQARRGVPLGGRAARYGRTRTLVYGALCITLSFVLSYFKLFSMPFGGSITLCSMLPIVVYAVAFGPGRGLLAGLAYAVLQVIQGAYIVHWAQFLLDYFVAFTCLGLAGFFPGRLALGMSAAGLCRMLVSVVSGAIFFADAGMSYGIADPWVYSLAYNGLTIGVDTVLCVLVSLLPPLKKAVDRI